jgi:hypothetical protein
LVRQDDRSFVLHLPTDEFYNRIRRILEHFGGNTVTHPELGAASNVSRRGKRREGYSAVTRIDANQRLKQKDDPAVVGMQLLRPLEEQVTALELSAYGESWLTVD